MSINLIIIPLSLISEVLVLMENLGSIWHDLAGKYCSNARLIDTFWKEIESAYTAANRHYHNLNHLTHLISQYLEHQNNVEDQDAFLFAIFYHDVVYDVKKQNNEEKSAEVAVERMMALEVPREIIEKCRHMILATKAHEHQGDPDTDLLTDIDLSILAATAERYAEYCEQIRKEYRIYPDMLYRPGRRKVIRHFLDADHIFSTEFFREQMEKAARKNLEDELNNL